MPDKGKMVFRNSPGFSLGLGLASLGAFVLGLLGSYQLLVEKDYEALVFTGLFTIALGVAGVWSVLRFKIEVGPDFIEKREIRTTRFLYREIDTVDISEGRLILFSGDKKIDVYSSGGLRDATFEMIADRLKSRTDIKATGNSEMIEAYFPSHGSRTGHNTPEI